MSVLGLCIPSGSGVAEFAGRTLHSRLIGSEEYKRSDFAAALKRAFLGTDEALRVSPHYALDPSGCTAVAALLVKTPQTTEEKESQAPKPDKPEKIARRIYVANTGDSRSVISLQGEARPLSFDHKPMNPDENARIIAAGGFVEFNRVNGNLALSRALGDFEFKQNANLPPERQVVTADPEIVVYDITGEEEFLVLACDGIWDCLSNQQVVDFIRRGLAQGRDPSELCEQIMDKCLAPPSDLGGIGCDNMTIQVITLLGGRTKAEYYAWIKERVDKKIGWDTPDSIPDVFRSQGGTGLGPEGTNIIDEEDEGPGRVSAVGGASPPGGLVSAATEEDKSNDRLPQAVAQALTAAGRNVDSPTLDAAFGDHDQEAAGEAHPRGSCQEAGAVTGHVGASGGSSSGAEAQEESAPKLPAPQEPRGAQGTDAQ